MTREILERLKVAAEVLRVMAMPEEDVFQVMVRTTATEIHLSMPAFGRLCIRAGLTAENVCSKRLECGSERRTVAYRDVTWSCIVLAPYLARFQRFTSPD